MNQQDLFKLVRLWTDIYCVIIGNYYRLISDSASKNLFQFAVYSVVEAEESPYQILHARAV